MYKFYAPRTSPDPAAENFRDLMKQKYFRFHPPFALLSIISREILTARKKNSEHSPRSAIKLY